MRSKTPQTSKTKRLVRHNVLFERWITKAMEEAFTKELKSYHTYKKALFSLRKYPLMLSSGKECRILEGFGPKLCDFLDDMLSKYAAELDMSPAAALLHGNREASMQASSVTTQLSLSSTTASLHPLPRTVDTLNYVYTESATTATTIEQSTSCTVSASTSVSELSSAEKQLLEVLSSSKNPLGCSLQELAACLRSPGSNHNITSVIDNLGRLTSRGLIYSIPDRPGRYRLTDNAPSGSNSSSVMTISECFSFSKLWQLDNYFRNVFIRSLLIHILLCEPCLHENQTSFCQRYGLGQQPSECYCLSLLQILTALCVTICGLVSVESSARLYRLIGVG
ncbi:hypothetical protein PHET_09817 [Paragonimus heterotremus]|uniref:Crossover junction endonuclease MUS81-like HHH domain-containing protein n=1 Tax=Paragonimus heterotremus TaxID=100268 RepID=A0A8J4WEG1_9TREM|nr:hypothetical protein PHET_09817 [Paragonimus heterotremus]